MVQAKLEEVRYSYSITTSCPRCKKRVGLNVTRRQRPYDEDIELRCDGCGLIFKETVYFTEP